MGLRLKGGGRAALRAGRGPPAQFLPPAARTKSGQGKRYCGIQLAGVQSAIVQSAVAAQMGVKVRCAVPVLPCSPFFAPNLGAGSTRGRRCHKPCNNEAIEANYDPMTSELYAKLLGGIFANFQTLELFLRSFLSRLPDAKPLGYPGNTNIFGFPVGSSVPLSDLTSDESLGDLCKRFNEETRKYQLPSQVDETLSDIRNALAHGKVAWPASESAEKMRLLMFSRPKKPSPNSVTITFNELMTKHWLVDQNQRVVHAIETVQSAVAEMDSRSDKTP